MIPDFNNDGKIHGNFRVQDNLHIVLGLIMELNRYLRLVDIRAAHYAYINLKVHLLGYIFAYRGRMVSFL